MLGTAKVNRAIQFGPYILDSANKRLTLNEKRVPLGPLEIRLLETLLREPKRVFTGDELRTLVWSDDPNATEPPAGDANSLYISISKLRAGLGKHGKWIVNIPKVGYTISEKAVVDILEPEPDANPDSTAAAGSHFVGRGQELEMLCQAVLTSSRVVTITGPPGIGKTRLAVEALGQLRANFDDGVHFIDLRSIGEGLFVPKAVLSALALPESPGHDILKELVQALAGQAVLLVFDNCEHLAESVASVASAIGESASKVRIVATSTQSLGLANETIIPIGPLPTPPRTDAFGPDDLPDYPSANLFLILAKERRPDLTLSAADALNVAELCRNLEGIPIAIELAASYVDAYTIEQILDAMSESFHLLRLRRGEDARHKTLEAAIAWSYGLLPEDERSLITRLSVLRGGWTAASALAVCGKPGQKEGAIVHMLASLVRRSLIQLSHHEKRYGMLEMIRQFCRSRLRESGEEDEILHSRTRYLLSLAEESFEDGDRGEWPAIIRAEYDNMRAVLRRCVVEKVDPILGVRLCGALSRFWFYNGYINEALHWTDLSLANDDGSDEAARGRALTAAGFFFGQMPGAKDDSKKRLSYFEESLRIWRKLDDKKNLGVTLIGYSYMMNRMGNYDAAVSSAREALETFRQTDFHFQTARAANNLALAYLDTGNFDLAKPLLEEALADARLSDDTLLEAICIHNLADLAIQTNELEAARSLIDVCLPMFEELGQRSLVARTTLLKGEMLAGMGDLIPAIEVQQSALQEFEQMHDNQSIALSLETFGSTLGKHLNEPSAALDLLSAARTLRDQLNILLGPARKEKIEDILDQIREKLGEETFSKLMERAQRFPVNKAVAEALAYRP